MTPHQKTIFNILNHIDDEHPEFRKILLQKHKNNLSNSIKKYHKNTVAHGPFKGLKFVDDSHWGGSDRGAMILGIYELEVLNELKDIPKRFDTFIDLGAADGYYAIGVLVNDMFEKSYCYEITESGRDVILKNSILNDVGNRVIIRGIADKNFVNDFSNEELQNSVLFVDIEGGEFDLFDSNIFHSFYNSIIFIESHDFFYNDGDLKFNKLISDSEHTHIPKIIKMGARDLSNFPELEKLDDTDRWMICSEGRAQLMRWIRFDPIEHIL